MEKGGENTDVVGVEKPPGKVTEVSRGGYSLKAVLDWSHVSYNEIRVCNVSLLNLLIPDQHGPKESHIPTMR